MNRRIRFDAQASIELTEAVRWYESQRPGLGAELLDAVDDEEILVVAVAHTKRRPDYWIERL